ncbi:hypothetical protein [Nonomuraea sediminis]|uniref:hypothetical protein n=1 Tax=Nonomuraea sediminis TaxID=2835864 RepID=UPI001BDBD72A|nr:hypothetical protein [Nonomuraea sediminis]
MHRPRNIAYLGLRELPGWRVKLYGIAWQGAEPRPDLLQAGAELAGRVLLEQRDHHGLGFCVVHEARGMTYVLVDWWACENEIHQRLFSTSDDAFAPHPSDAIGCVWELAVVDFERRAWLRHVLANPGGPDEDAYLRETFNGKV